MPSERSRARSLSVSLLTLLLFRSDPEVGFRSSRMVKVTFRLASTATRSKNISLGNETLQNKGFILVPELCRTGWGDLGVSLGRVRRARWDWSGECKLRVRAAQGGTTYQGLGVLTRAGCAVWQCTMSRARRFDYGRVCGLAAYVPSLVGYHIGSNTGLV